jgi:hypothetical protein
VTFKIPQVNTAITESKGLVTRPWYKFLRELFNSADDMERISIKTITDSSTSTGQIIFAKSSEWSSWTENTNYSFISKTRGITYETSTGKFTVPVNGDYAIWANILVETGEANQLDHFRLIVNGSASFEQDVYISGASEEQQLSMNLLQTFSAGDEVQIAVQQSTSASNKNITVIAQSSLCIWRVAG